MTLTQKSLIALLVTSVLFCAALFFASSFTPFAFGSNMSEASDYMATSTAASAAYGATITGGRLIKPGHGSFSTVVITGANTGIVNFYDATTTDITKREARFSTSTILIASFPASAAAGDYVFDAQYTTGLFIDLVSGNMPTSTITYR